MEPTHRNAARRTLILALIVSILPLAASAQPIQAASAPMPVPPAVDRVKRTNCEPPYACFVQSFYLANAIQGNEANEILTTIRNILPQDPKVILVPSKNIIVVEGTTEELALVQKIIAETDQPKKNFRLTFTITEMDAGKHVGAQHFSMVAAAGQRTTLKQGSKVPIATGSLATNTSGAQTQFTYIDVGMSFDVTLTEVANGAVLKAKVEQSSVAEEKSGAGPQDPVVRQTALEGSPVLTLGKPLMLGSIDVAGSTRHLDVEVLMEAVK